MLSSMRAGYARVAPRTVIASCRAKRIVPGTPHEGEEWALGPWPILRHFRLLLESLASLAKGQLPPVGDVDLTSEGAVRVEVFPGDTLDTLALPGTQTHVHLQPGLGLPTLGSRGRLYRGAPYVPAIALVLGAGNAAAIPCMDLLTRMFNHGMACVLKMHPLNSYLGPLYEEAFAAAIERGFVRIVYGGADAGNYLCQHPAIDEIHLTGSEETYNRIVRAAPGKPISAQLGCVSPLLIVPAVFSERQLKARAAAVAGAITHNAGCNCTTPRLIVTPYAWDQRDAFLREVEHALVTTPLRMAYYPGATERWKYLSSRHPEVVSVGSVVGGMLPWTIVPDLDPADENEPLFSLEAFCPVVGEVQIGSDTPLEYLEDAVAFVNERVGGSLSTTVLVHPRSLKDVAIGEGVDQAINHLRYGTVGINSWPQLAFALAAAPWGAHQAAATDESPSGTGWVHNTAMLDGVDKTVIRERVSPCRKPVFAAGRRSALHLFNRLASLELERNWAAVPGVIGATFQG